jgi:predicted TIM-barrel fold metal-dependent hydrolase
MAGIRRAVVLSVAYSFSNPNKPAVPNEYAMVKAENDWTGEQVAKYPDRPIGFCSVNPLKAYALEEISRCAKNEHLRTGLKLHFGNSDVDVANPEHLAKLRRVFRAANENGMAIAAHMRSTMDLNRPYGARQAHIIIEQLFPEAPDVTIQIAHLGGGGGYDATIDAAVAVFVEAIAHRDPRVKNVYFDVSGVAGPGNWRDQADLIVARIRKIGIGRLLYGSDAPIPGNLPKEALGRWRQLPLTADEFRMIDSNVAPYLRER